MHHFMQEHACVDSEAYIRIKSMLTMSGRSVWLAVVR
jgi:hypothetical protein